jgi:hypothetical protein
MGGYNDSNEYFGYLFGSSYYFAFDYPQKWINNVSGISYQNSIEPTNSAYRSVLKELNRVNVSYNGTDGSSCGSKSSPCKTITYAYKNRISSNSSFIYLVNNITDSSSGGWGITVTKKVNPLVIQGLNLENGDEFEYFISKQNYYYYVMFLFYFLLLLILG